MVLLFAAALAVLVTACGSDDSSGEGVDLNWFVATQPGGSIQEVAKRCTEESNGEYNVNVELLPTDAEPAARAARPPARRRGLDRSTSSAWT